MGDPSEWRIPRVGDATTTRCRVACRPSFVSLAVCPLNPPAEIRVPPCRPPNALRRARALVFRAGRGRKLPCVRCAARLASGRARRRSPMPAAVPFARPWRVRGRLAPRSGSSSGIWFGRGAPEFVGLPLTPRPPNRVCSQPLALASPSRRVLIRAARSRRNSVRSGEARGCRYHISARRLLHLGAVKALGR